MALLPYLSEPANTGIVQVSGGASVAFSGPMVGSEVLLNTLSDVAVIWTPPAGKRFRLQGVSIAPLANASTTAASGQVSVVLIDGPNMAANFIIGHVMWVPAAAATTFQPLDRLTINFPLTGYVSKAANNLLQAMINAPQSLATGFISVMCWGDAI